MRQIVLSGDNWTLPGDVYTALLSSLEAPAWHGRNLDALWDSIMGGDINGINPPFLILVTGTHSLPEDCKTLLNRIKELLSEANGADVDVEMRYS
jgi:RNAse (barnase) inhibitor barstar